MKGVQTKILTEPKHIIRHPNGESLNHCRAILQQFQESNTEIVRDMRTVLLHLLRNRVRLSDLAMPVAR